MKFKKVKLNKGGMLYYTKNKINSSTAVEINFDCGSRCNKIDGLAHFVEHMFFTGTATMSKEDIAKKYFDFIHVNAFTNVFGIRFTGKVFTNEFENYLNTVATMITESTFSQENIDKEIPVVCQEIASYKDHFFAHSEREMNYLSLHLPEYKNGNLGTEKSVKSIKSEDVKEYVDKYFVSNNLDVFVVSPLPLRKVKKLVVKNLESKLKQNKEFERFPYHYQDIIDNKFYSVQNKQIPKSYVYINFFSNHGIYDFVYKNKFSLILDMLNDFSEGVMNKLRLEKSLVYGAGFSCRYYKTNSAIRFDTECDKTNINEVIITLAEYLKSIAKNGFTQAQLDKAKRLYDYNEEVKEERVEGLVGKLFRIKLFGKPFDNKEYRKTIKETTLEECNKMFCEIFKNPTVSMLVYGDAKKDEVMSKKEFNNLFKYDK